MEWKYNSKENRCSGGNEGEGDKKDCEEKWN